jgi:hypothetical protein
LLQNPHSRLWVLHCTASICREVTLQNGRGRVGLNRECPDSYNRAKQRRAGLASQVEFYGKMQNYKSLGAILRKPASITYTALPTDTPFRHHVCLLLAQDIKGLQVANILHTTQSHLRLHLETSLSTPFSLSPHTLPKPPENTDLTSNNGLA